MSHRLLTLPMAPRLVWLWLILAAGTVILAMLAVSKTHPPAFAPFVRSVGMLEDTTASLRPADLRSMRFAPSDGLLAEGYTRSAFWLRIALDRPSVDDGTVILRFYPPVLDSITLHVFPLGDAASGVTGPPDGIDATTPQQDYLRGTAVTIPPGGAEVLVRIASVGSITASLDILTPRQAMDSAVATDFLQIAYLALLAGLLLWSLRMHALTPDRLFLVYALVQSVWLPYNLLFFGYLPLFIQPWDDWQFSTLRVLAILNTFAGIIFHRMVLVRHDPPKAAVRVLDALAAISALTLPVFLAGERALALQMNGICIFVFPFVLILMATTARRDAGAGLLALRLLYLLFCISLFFWIFTLLGFGSAQASDRYFVILHGLSTGLLMFILLRLHGNGLLATLRQAEEALVAADTLRRVERRYSEMRLRFIDMLAHETRNALAVINMSLAGKTFGDRQRDRIRHTIADLELIIDRSMQMAQIKHEDADVAVAGFDLVHLAQTIRATIDQGCRIDLRAPPELLIQSDPVLVKVILSNLAENALKYSADGSPVIICLSQDRDRATITVENAASTFGMPDPARVFQKFYRSERAQARFGSGLGLNISLHLATVLGGTIHYRPEGDTVRFTLELPC